MTANTWGEPLYLVAPTPFGKSPWRQTPLRFFSALLVLLCAPVVLLAAEPTSRVKVTVASDGSRIEYLSWDTEGSPQAERNLLRNDKSQTAMLWKKTDGKWSSAGDAVRITSTPIDGGFDLVLAPEATTNNSIEAVRLVFPFNLRSSSVTVLPSRISANEAFHFPAIVSAPGFGQMLVTCQRDLGVTSTFQGSRSDVTADWTVDIPLKAEIPLKDAAEPPRLSFRPVYLPPPKGLKDKSRWPLVRRAWFNVFQISAQWGDQKNFFSAPSGKLANNIVSDPVSSCLFIYADSALSTPDLAEGVSAMQLVGHTLDWWLNDRTLETGEAIGYWDLKNFLDANPSLLISAWDYHEATGDRKWLADRIEKLERAANFVASRDVDHDGLIEAVQSGNAGTLIEPIRSCSAYDAVNCGYKDAYCNALAYRGFRCLAELEGVLGRKDKQQQYAQLADRIKAAFAKELFNPKTGLIAWWKSQDGVIHDYASPFVNALAIEYELVDRAKANEILDRLAEQFKKSKFERFDLGVPCTLIPVRREDYLLPNGPGLGKLEDGSDTLGEYLNGGIFTGESVHYIVALYCMGRSEEADSILDRMIGRISLGDADTGGFATSVVNHYPEGGEFWTWDGRTSGYEGLLTHAWHFTQAVVMREPELRERFHRPLKAK